MNKLVVQNLNVGVDVGKDFLDIHIRPLGEYLKVSNDKKGIGEAIKRLRKLTVERIVIEATGRYEIAFVSACAKAALPFSVVNPIHVKRFAEQNDRLGQIRLLYILLRRGVRTDH